MFVCYFERVYLVYNSSLSDTTLLGHAFDHHCTGAYINIQFSSESTIGQLHRPRSAWTLVSSRVKRLTCRSWLTCTTSGFWWASRARITALDVACCHPRCARVSHASCSRKVAISEALPNRKSHLRLVQRHISATCLGYHKHSFPALTTLAIFNIISTKFHVHLVVCVLLSFIILT